MDKYKNGVYLECRYIDPNTGKQCRQVIDRDISIRTDGLCEKHYGVDLKMESKEALNKGLLDPNNLDKNWFMKKHEGKVVKYTHEELKFLRHYIRDGADNHSILMEYGMTFKGRRTESGVEQKIDVLRRELNIPDPRPEAKPRQVKPYKTTSDFTKWTKELEDYTITLWNQGMEREDVAKAINKKFKINKSPSAVSTYMSKLRKLGLRDDIIVHRGAVKKANRMVEKEKQLGLVNKLIDERIEELQPGYERLMNEDIDLQKQIKKLVEQRKKLNIDLGNAESRMDELQRLKDNM